MTSVTGSGTGTPKATEGAPRPTLTTSGQTEQPKTETTVNNVMRTGGQKGAGMFEYNLISFLIETLEIGSGDLSKRPNVSRDLAQFICRMPHLKNLTLNGSCHDEFYSTSLAMASTAKIETLDIGSGELSKRPNVSRDLAQFICRMPHLKNLTLNGSCHDEFYSTSLAMASTAKVWIWSYILGL
eukprot:XP_011666531.1 PREDICTED: uncharacterized protein LOC105439349 [Strongylocentrotus purpuratus]